MAWPCKRVLPLLCLLIITAAENSSNSTSGGEESGGEGSDGEHEKAKSSYPPAGAALLGTIVFMLVLNYVTNADDPDIRRYATGIIHSTMGIFCAIMTQTADIGLIIGYVDPVVSDDASILIRFAIAIFWFILLQLALAYFSNLFMKDDAYKAYYAKSVNRINTKLNLSTACTYLAHTTAFHCINAWVNVQVLKEWFKFGGRGEAFLSVICAAAFIFILRALAKLVRTLLIGMDGKIEHREELWLEHVNEAEEDVASLLMAYILTRAIMQWIAGSFPSEEQMYEEDVEVTHATVGYIYLFGFSSVIVALLLLLLRPSVGEEMLKEEAEEEEEIMEGGEHGHGHHAGEGGEHGHGHHAGEGHASGHGAHEKPSPESPPKEAAKSGFCARLSPTIDWFVRSCVLCLIMVFAFAIFEASVHAFKNIDSLEDDDDTLSALALTAILSGCSFALIFIVDKISDNCKSESEGGTLELVLQMIIKGAGLLVGITWEHLFEVAINQCATGAAETHAVESALSMGAVLVVAPAWRMYIAPVVILGGWRFGMVPDMVVEKARKLTRGLSCKPHHRKQAEEFAKEYSKIIHILQTLHTEEHRKDEFRDVTASHFKEVLQKVWEEMDEKPAGDLQI